MRGFRVLVAAALGAGALAFGVGAAPLGSAPATANAQLVGHVNPGGGYSADVYAHRGHAYLSSWRGGSCPALGVRIYSLADPRKPRLTATFADARSDPEVAGSWTEKTIVQRVQTPSFTGDLAATSFQSCGDGGFQGFGLYDVTDPTKPRKLALVPTEPRGVHEIWLQARGDRAYVYAAIPFSELLSSADFDAKTRKATIPGEPDFRIFDVSDPVNTTQVGEWGAWTELGVHPNNGRGRFLKSNFAHSVTVDASATRAYVAYWDLGTVTLDISNPAAPRYVGRTGTTSEPEGDAHSVWLGNGGRLLVETHESSTGRPTFYDISNSARPRRLGALALPSPGQPARGLGLSVHDPEIVGGRAYFSWYSQGVVVADVSRASRPRRIAQFVPQPTLDREGTLCEKRACVMTWGVDVEGGYVLASDMVSGLWVFRVGKGTRTLTASPAAEGTRVVASREDPSRRRFLCVPGL